MSEVDVSAVAPRPPGRVLVTGGAGFIGSHTVSALIAQQATVMVIDDLRHRSPRPLDPRADLLPIDIGSPEAVQAIARFKPHVVLHLAAQGGVRRSWRDPVEDATINVLGTVNVLQAASDAGCRRLVMASSGGALYGHTDDLPTGEGHPAQPRSPYGTAKLAAEAYLGTYGRTLGISTLALRYANVYGPGQDGSGEAGVVAITCSRLLLGARPLLRGDGLQTRDFVFAGDVAAANLAAVHHPDATGAINVGTAVRTPVRTVVAGLCEIAGVDPVFDHDAPAEGEVMHSCLDIRLAAAQLGWRPKTSLSAGLRATFESFAAAAGAGSTSRAGQQQGIHR